MAIPRPLVAPALWGFGAGLLTLSFPTALLVVFALAVAGASMRLPRVAAFAAAAGATSAALIVVSWARCALSAPQHDCTWVSVLAPIAVLTAAIGVTAAALMAGRYRA